MSERGLFVDDLNVGDRFVHERSRTIDAAENAQVTLRALNTAENHFSLPSAVAVMDGRFTERLVVGGFVIAVVVGLTAERLSEHALRDVALHDVVLRSPVYPGDTLYATSEILAISNETTASAHVRYRFEGTNQRSELVVIGERTVELRRAPQ